MDWPIPLGSAQHAAAGFELILAGAEAHDLRAAPRRVLKKSTNNMAQASASTPAVNAADAQSNLGVMYRDGQSVPQDYVEAHKWYNLSAARATEKETRENATHNRDIVTAKMTPTQVAEAQKRASEWKPTTAP
ncbi:MAG: hypothetical protein EXR86_03515 [Gammaproteobacteria bacterium]|nr:hypothetical protein [Gammaproteobacteria bacterium]